MEKRKAAVLIPGRLALGPAGSTQTHMVRLSFEDIAASEFRQGRYEVCHYNRRDLGVADGPLAMDQTLWFARELHARLQDGSAFVMVEFGPEERRNAAAMVGSYLVLAQGWSAEQVRKALPKDAREKFPCCWLHSMEMRTARGAPRMLVQDCWEGVQMAREKGWLQADVLQDSVKTSLAASKLWRTCEAHDSAWLVPGEVLVMADPVTTIMDPDPRTSRGWRAAPDTDSDDELEAWSPVPSVPFVAWAECKEESSGTKESSGTSSQSTTLGGGSPRRLRRAACKVVEEEERCPDNVSVFTACKDYLREAGDAAPLPGRAEPRAMMEFLSMENVAGVVRVNKGSEPGLVEIGGSYDPSILAEHGIHHVDVPVSDSLRDGRGAVPPAAAFRTFFDEVQRMVPEAGQAICVHCKGGFGRSVMLACALVIHRYNVPGRALLGWVRMMRPGAVTTPEQEAFLCAIRGEADLRGWIEAAEGGVDSVPAGSAKGGCCVVS